MRAPCRPGGWPHLPFPAQPLRLFSFGGCGLPPARLAARPGRGLGELLVVPSLPSLRKELIRP